MPRNAQTRISEHFEGPYLPHEGRQGARMADRILKGAKPAVLPVETAEYFLTINLKKAQEMGLDISDDILRQADTIIR